MSAYEKCPYHQLYRLKDMKCWTCPHLSQQTRATEVIDWAIWTVKVSVSVHRCRVAWLALSAHTKATRIYSIWIHTCSHSWNCRPFQISLTLIQMYLYINAQKTPWIHSIWKLTVKFSEWDQNLIWFEYKSVYTLSYLGKLNFALFRFLSKLIWGCLEIGFRAWKESCEEVHLIHHQI